VSTGDASFVVLLDTGSNFGLTVDEPTSRQLSFVNKPVPGPPSFTPDYSPTDCWQHNWRHEDVNSLAEASVGM